MRMAILARCQEVCESPKWSHQIKSLIEIQSKLKTNCYQIPLKLKKKKQMTPPRLWRLSPPAWFNQEKYGGRQKAIKAKCQYFFIVAETLHPWSNETPANARAYCVKLFPFPMHKLFWWVTLHSQKRYKRVCRYTQSRKIFKYNSSAAWYLCCNVYKQYSR